MLARQRALESENHIGEHIGDMPPGMRADFEDALVQALEDTLQDNRLEAFRSFMEKYRREFPPDTFALIRSQDSWAWYTVYYYACTLRRMGPRWEHCANKLMQQFGMDPQQIPNGQDFLYR